MTFYNSKQISEKNKISKIKSIDWSREEFVFMNNENESTATAQKTDQISLKIVFEDGEIVFARFSDDPK